MVALGVIIGLLWVRCRSKCWVDAAASVTYRIKGVWGDERCSVGLMKGLVFGCCRR